MKFHGCFDKAIYWQFYDNVKEKFNKTGKIKGFEVLNIQTLDKLWISYYDMEILSKHE